ncbi:MAG: PorT family protein [Saprospiraceae bacterium]|nr:PorT family protein [Saprospiraceae bacterium]
MIKWRYSFYLVLIVSMLEGQSQFGFRAGVNFAQLSEMALSSGVDMKWMEGIYFACFLEKNVGDYFNVQPEFAFVQKGYKVKGTDTNLQIRGSSNTSVSYVQFGSTLKLKIIDSDVMWTLNGGGSIALALFGINELKLFPASGETSATTRLEFGRDKYRRVDFEIYLGTGLSVPIGEISLLLDAGYGWGVLDIEEENDTLHPQNRSMRATIGIAWQID